GAERTELAHDFSRAFRDLGLMLGHDYCSTPLAAWATSNKDVANPGGAAAVPLRARPEPMPRTLPLASRSSSVRWTVRVLVARASASDMLHHGSPPHNRGGSSPA